MKSNPTRAARRGAGDAGKLLWLAIIGLLATFAASTVKAEPYLAVQTGYKCVQCHVNPTGGGMRTQFGLVFAENVMPMNRLPEGAPVWLGQAIQDIVRVGGDLRTDYFDRSTPHERSQNGFQLEQLRLYADVTLLPNKLGIYVDEQVAPDGATNMEAYVRLGSQSNFYMKAGQFYLPFGWRLQDQSSFVREFSFVSMAAPDRGVEFGMERGKWSAQLDFTNGTAGLTSSGIQEAQGGRQAVINVVRTESIWRVGVSGLIRHSDLGNRNEAALYAGLRTGPVVWLTEADLIHQNDLGTPGAPGPQTTTIPAFIEADWLIYRGNNLKLTYDYLDPQRRDNGNGQSRWSVVYELTPFPFVQLRAGVRRNSGPSEVDSENAALTFAELHAFL
jgi:hypothetical protein